MNKKSFNFEAYFCNPVTLEGGWDIKMISVFAETKIQAKEILKKVPYFDCIILFNYEVPMNDADVKVYENGTNYRILEYINGYFQ